VRSLGWINLTWPLDNGQDKGGWDRLSWDIAQDETGTCRCAHRYRALVQTRGPGLHVSGWENIVERSE
jgi:hypothetical protein